MISALLMTLALSTSPQHYTLTAYCTCKICCGHHAKGVTKMGTKAIYTRRIVAVDPKHIRLGSRIYIHGYGYYRAEDTGKRIKGNKIDILVKNHWQAKQFGKRQGRVEEC